MSPTRRRTVAAYDEARLDASEHLDRGVAHPSRRLAERQHRVIAPALARERLPHEPPPVHAVDGGLVRPHEPLHHPLRSLAHDHIAHGPP